MMSNHSDEIFHLNDNKLTSMPLHPMREGLLGKTLEDALQTFLEKYPQIIPGKQVDPASDEPPRFVLLRREMPVGGWSLDHLYVDQRGILTLVETKLFQNPESRREVIGQIIEYAANAKEFWSQGRARQKSVEFWNNLTPPEDLDEVLRREFGEELDIDEFWGKIDENLEYGKIRLIIAADELRPEVRRMIEYLNNEMRNADIFGLELKFYGKRTGSMVLVPRLIGQSQSTLDKKRSNGSSVTWPADKLKTTYSKFSDNNLAVKLQKILSWSVEKKVFKMATTKFPAFGIEGKNKKRIASIFSHGDIYVVFSDKFYAGGVKERDELVAELKKLNYLDKGFDPQKVVSGRNLPKKLSEMTDEEIDNLLQILGKH